MSKKLSFLLLSLLFFSSIFWSIPSLSQVSGATGPVWIPASDLDSSQPPQIQVQVLSDTSLQIQIRFPGLWAESQTTAHGDFTRLFLVGYGHSAALGAPDLPIFTTQLEIPEHVSALISQIETKTTKVSLSALGLPETVFPMQRPVSKSGPTPPWQPPAEGLYQQTSFYPPHYAELMETYQMRDHHIMPLQISPVHYQPNTGQLELLQEINLTITWNTPAQADRAINQPGSVVFDALAKDLVVNPGSAELDTKNLEGVGYLIITPQEFIPTLAPFVLLKQAEGYQVTVSSTETIGSSAAAIKTHIEYAYHNWDVPPTYLLLVGDTNFIPSWLTSQTPACTVLPCFRKATDLYYATITPDFVPDLLVGRLPAKDTAELTTIVNKLRDYAVADGTEDWVQKAAFVATADNTYYPVAEGSHDYVITNHTLPRGYTGIFPTNPYPFPGGDKLYYKTFDAKESHLTAAINDERSLIIYSGHGSTLSWSDFSFTSSDINLLEPDQVYPFVAGFACETNDIANTTYPTVFGETWLVTPNKGAIAYLGSADFSYWGPDDTFERSLFDHFFEESTHTPPLSSAAFAGLSAVQTQHPDYSRYYWETYMLLGDPSQRILTVPRTPFFESHLYPDPVEVCIGVPEEAQLYVAAVDGFTEEITYSTSGLPAGISATFGQNPITPSADTTLTFATDTSAPLGETSFTLLGTSTHYSESSTIDLLLTNQNPQLPLLFGPDDQKTVDSESPSLNWESVDQTHTYEVQIATDRNFENIVLNDLIRDDSGAAEIIYPIPLPLKTSTAYYWRVRGINACGLGTYSSVWQFRTPIGPGDCPAGYVSKTDFLYDFETASTEWVSDNPDNNNEWTRQTTLFQSPFHSYFAADIDTVSLTGLTSPVFQIPSGAVSPTLHFWQWYEIEKSSSISDVCFDGGLIKYNQGEDWVYLEENRFLPTPTTYTGTIATSNGNPLGGKRAWCGSSGGWVKTVIDLDSFQNQALQFKFQLGTDDSVGRIGWYIDDVQLQSCYPLEQTFLPVIRR